MLREPIDDRVEHNPLEKREVLLRKKVLPITVLVIAIIFIVASISGYLSGRMPSDYRQTAGTVVSIMAKEIRQPGHGNTYVLTDFPIISYSVNGQSYQMTGSGSRDNYSSEKTIGDKVSVSYNPANPASSPRLTADKGPLIGLIVISLFGFLLIGLSIYLFRRNKRINPEQDDYQVVDHQPVSQSANPNGVPILALVAGYMAPFAIIIVPAPVVLITGMLALVDIKKHPGSGGIRRSWFAIVLGLIGSIVLIYGIYVANSRH